MFLSKKILSRLKNYINFIVGKQTYEEFRLKRMPRYEAGTSTLIHPSIKYVDSASLLSAYREIFKNGIYDFKCEGRPKIIDCGANIGLGIIYWKRKFPDAKIIGFEPDPVIFSVLQKNIKKQGYSDVSLYKKGVYFKDDTLKFYQEGADGGHLIDRKNESADDNFITVSVVDLKNYLTDPVDMLKIDIEGAETDVITNCEEELRNVKNLFVEYHSYINKEQRLNEILYSLKRAGFRYHIHPELVAKQPFVAPAEDNEMDNRINIFAYR